MGLGVWLQGVEILFAGEELGLLGGLENVLDTLNAQGALEHNPAALITKKRLHASLGIGWEEIGCSVEAPSLQSSQIADVFVPVVSLKRVTSEKLISSLYKQSINSGGKHV